MERFIVAIPSCPVVIVSLPSIVISTPCVAGEVVNVVSKLSYQYLFNNASDGWTSELDGYFLVQFILKDKAIIPHGVGLIYLDKKTDELISEKYTDKLNIDQNKLLDIFYDIYNNEPIRHIYN